MNKWIYDWRRREKYEFDLFLFYYQSQKYFPYKLVNKNYIIYLKINESQHYN